MIGVCTDTCIAHQDGSVYLNGRINNQDSKRRFIDECGNLSDDHFVGNDHAIGSGSGSFDVGGLEGAALNVIGQLRGSVLVDVDARRSDCGLEGTARNFDVCTGGADDGAVSVLVGSLEGTVLDLKHCARACEFDRSGGSLDVGVALDHKRGSSVDLDSRAIAVVNELEVLQGYVRVLQVQAGLVRVHDDGCSVTVQRDAVQVEQGHLSEDGLICGKLGLNNGEILQFSCIGNSIVFFVGISLIIGDGTSVEIALQNLGIQVNLFLSGIILALDWRVGLIVFVSSILIMAVSKYLKLSY